MLDLDALPEQPPEIHRHPGGTHQHNEHDRHKRQDRSTLAVGGGGVIGHGQDGPPVPKISGSSLARAVSCQVCGGSPSTPVIQVWV